VANNCSFGVLPAFQALQALMLEIPLQPQDWGMQFSSLPSKLPLHLWCPGQVAGAGPFTEGRVQGERVHTEGTPCAESWMAAKTQRL